MTSALIVYESMFGPTRRVAEAVAAGAGDLLDIHVGSVHDIDPDCVASAGVLIVGAPTVRGGLSTSRQREDVLFRFVEEHKIRFDAHAGGIGVHEWLTAVAYHDGWCAGFDTTAGTPRRHGAAYRIERMLRRSGWEPIIDHESFQVRDTEMLADGEAARAQSWGRRIAESVAAYGTRS